MTSRYQLLGLVALTCTALLCVTAYMTDNPCGYSDQHDPECRAIISASAASASAARASASAAHHPAPPRPPQPTRPHLTLVPPLPPDPTDPSRRGRRYRLHGDWDKPNGVIIKVNVIGERPFSMPINEASAEFDEVVTTLGNGVIFTIRPQRPGRFPPDIRCAIFDEYEVPINVSGPADPRNGVRCLAPG